VEHTDFFLIEPNDAARSKFPVALGENSVLLLEPALTSRSSPDRSPWRRPELELAVKLIFVAQMREYEFLSSDTSAQLILGSVGVSVDVFDRWWTIRRLEFEARSEELEDFLVAIADQVEATGNAVVDDWVKSLVAATGKAR
jgi:hypothetical protein